MTTDSRPQKADLDRHNRSQKAELDATGSGGENANKKPISKSQIKTICRTVSCRKVACHIRYPFLTKVYGIDWPKIFKESSECSKTFAIRFSLNLTCI